MPHRTICLHAACCTSAPCPFIRALPAHRQLARERNEPLSPPAGVGTRLEACPSVLSGQVERQAPAFLDITDVPPARLRGYSHAWNHHSAHAPYVSVPLSSTAMRHCRAQSQRPLSGEAAAFTIRSYTTSAAGPSPCVSAPTGSLRALCRCGKVEASRLLPSLATHTASVVAFAVVLVTCSRPTLEFNAFTAPSSSRGVAATMTETA